MSATRRKFIGAGAGIAAASLGGTLSRQSHAPEDPSRRNWPVSSVSIVKAPAYDATVYDTIFRTVSEHKPDVRGKKVVLKPNLVEFDADAAINTHPLVVHAAYEAFRRLGAADVRIAEGPGHRRGTLDLADAAGYFDTVPNFESTFTDLNLDDVSKRDIPAPVSQLKSLYLPHTVLDCDLLVSLPKMKTHHWAGATLAMKNLFGLVPGGVYGWPKNLLHWAGIPQSIVDLHRLFPRQFAIVDGITGMEGNGPIQGTPKHAGVLVAGSDVVAVDATCCRLMGLDPAKIEYLILARGRANIEELKFRQIGERIATVKTDFQLLDQWKQIRAS